MSSQIFLDIIAKRRTHYQLKAESTIPDSRIKEIIESVILNVPSAFNSQTTRVILLLKDEHRKLWDIVKSVLKGVVPENLFPATEMKLNGFQGAYGTVCFKFL
jgi:predicted oxidoreductase (fatty acid repression mutant protein)